MDIKDLGGIGHATEKFLDAIQSAIGALYRPRSLLLEGRASADVEAYKMVALAKAERESQLIRSDAEQELAARAVERLRHQETVKQLNMESIVDKALNELGEDEVGENVDVDWLHYFFDSCGNI